MLLLIGVKKIAATETTLMRLQYSLIGSVRHSDSTHSIMLCFAFKGTLMQI